jgi:hypothetical protein
MFAALAAFAQSPSRPTNSAENSPKQDTRAANEQAVRDACADAATELIATRKLADALAAENALLKQRIATAERTAEIFAELDESRKAENAALNEALKAKNETIEAQTRLIRTQEEFAAKLKGKKRSLLGRIGDVLLGAAAIAIFK